MKEIKNVIKYEYKRILFAGLLASALTTLGCAAINHYFGIIEQN